MKSLMTTAPVKTDSESSARFSSARTVGPAENVSARFPAAKPFGGYPRQVLLAYAAHRNPLYCNLMLPELIEKLNASNRPREARGVGAVGAEFPRPG